MKKWQNVGENNTIIAARCCSCRPAGAAGLLRGSNTRRANQFPTDPFRGRDRQGVMAGSHDPHVVMTDSHDP